MALAKPITGGDVHACGFHCNRMTSSWHGWFVSPPGDGFPPTQGCLSPAVCSPSFPQPLLSPPTSPHIDTRSLPDLANSAFLLTENWKSNLSPQKGLGRKHPPISSFLNMKSKHNLWVAWDLPRLGWCTPNLCPVLCVSAWVTGFGKA